MTLYCKNGNHLLATYEAEDIIAKAGMDIMNFKQPTGQGPVEYVQALWTKTLRCGPVYNEYSLKGIVIELAKRVNPTKRPKLLGLEQVGFATGTSA